MILELKKIISAALILLFSAVFISGVSAVGHTSADQVFGSDGKTDLASVGNNDVTGTALGTITDDKITLWGWYADEQKIVEFGYRYGDSITLGSAKYKGEDDAVISEQASKLGYADGESVRFRIEDIPVVKGENVELYAVVKLADGTTTDIWKLTYTSEAGIQMPGSEQTPETTGDTAGPANPNTADTSLLSVVAAGCIAVSAVVIMKKIK